MDLPAEVQISNEVLGVKNNRAVLVAVSDHGFYEVRLTFNERQHKVLLPIAQTSVIFRHPEQEFSSEIEIER